MAGRKKTIDHERLSQVMEDIAVEIGALDDRGKLSDHIPELKEADPDRFGLAVVTCDGETIVAGDADEPFFIQSISKVFALTLALEAFGDKMWKRVGREPSGDPFNSIIDLERHEGIPRNPYINAGSLVVIDMLLEKAKKGETPDFVRDFLVEQTGDDSIQIDEKVAKSEALAGFRNRALANFSKSFGNLHHEVDDVMEVYVRQCVIPLSCRQLARAGRYLMIERSGADTGLAEARRHRRVSSLMLTCGMYDGSGEFAFRVGLPAKSGVGGGILAIAPNIASIAAWSPGLDESGNSLLGTLALERLSERMDWSVFGAAKKRD